MISTGELDSNFGNAHSAQGYLLMLVPFGIPAWGWCF
jgi:hypothetical protein